MNLPALIFFVVRSASHELARAALRLPSPLLTRVEASPRLSYLRRARLTVHRNDAPLFISKHQNRLNHQTDFHSPKSASQTSPRHRMPARHYSIPVVSSRARCPSQQSPPPAAHAHPEDRHGPWKHVRHSTFGSPKSKSRPALPWGPLKAPSRLTSGHRGPCGFARSVLASNLRQATRVELVGACAPGEPRSSLSP